MFACLYVPDFPVQAALLFEPPNTKDLLANCPVVVIDGPANLPRVVSLNKAARQFGLQVGMTKLQIEACSDAFIRKRSQENEDAAQITLLDCAIEFSPRVESTSPGTVILDLAGTEKLFGALQQTADKILKRASVFGFQLNIGIALNPDTALYAAKSFEGITIVPQGKEADCLGRLPIGVLPVSDEMSATLNSWGIHTFEAFAALPRTDLAVRLGKEAIELQKLALGEANRPIVPAEPSADFTESYEFEDPVETLEQLKFILNRLTQQVCCRLESRSFATSELQLNLELGVTQLRTGEGKESYERTWKLPFPTQNGRVLFRLIHLDLEGTVFAAPIKKVTIQVVPVKPRMVQSDLFLPPAPESEKLELTLARIRGVVGSTDENGIPCVGSPKTLDTHKPDTFTVEPYSTLAKDEENEFLPTVGLRMFRPPIKASVQFINDKPQLVTFARKAFRVIGVSGPWTSSGNWWNELSAWAREEWDVAVRTFEGIGYYRIYLDRVTKQWFVQGIFD